MQPDPERADEATPGVRIAPPLLFGGALALGLSASAFGATPTYGTRMRRALGVASIAIGAAVGGAALAEIKRAGSNVSPFAPTTELTTNGVFRFTRNPAYFGATSIYIGIALLARSLPALVLLPVALATLDRHVVDKEERYLDERFGERYRTYRATVPRWF